MIDFIRNQLAILPLGDRMQKVINAGLEAVLPEECIRRFIRRIGHDLVIDNDRIDLDQYHEVVILGAGKASIGMAKAAADILGERLGTSLIVSKNNPFQVQIDKVRILFGDHPIPGKNSQNAAESILERVETLRADDLVLFLISGGASALLTKPERLLTLDDLRLVTCELIKRGATIHEINTVRKQMDALKGGKLGRCMSTATIFTLAISDVPGDRLEDIGSGPTIDDPSTLKEALDVLMKYGLWKNLPASILHFFSKAVKKIAIEERLENTYNKFAGTSKVIANNRTAIEALVKQAELEGFQCQVIPQFVQGEARDVGREFANLLIREHRKRRVGDPPMLIAAGGEPTVTVAGNGRGGRNQELVLGAVGYLAGIKNVAMISIATDGEDGMTPACGAFITGEMDSNVKDIGLDPESYLRNNNSFEFFRKVGGLITTGPTGTNVNDLIILLLY